MTKISPFQPENQAAVQALILAGLEEHWGFLDESLNPDLKDIAASYEKGVFLVAWEDGAIIGTGAYLPHASDTVEIVRMSVSKHKRRQGIGCQILVELCNQAYQNGYQKAILETTATWQKVISFYQAFCFQITLYTDGDVYFALDLQAYFEAK